MYRAAMPAICAVSIIWARRQAKHLRNLGCRACRLSLVPQASLILSVSVASIVSLISWVSLISSVALASLISLVSLVSLTSLDAQQAIEQARNTCCVSVQPCFITVFRCVHIRLMLVHFWSKTSLKIPAEFGNKTSLKTEWPHVCRLCISLASIMHEFGIDYA